MRVTSEAQARVQAPRERQAPEPVKDRVLKPQEKPPEPPPKPQGPVGRNLDTQA